jgi:ribonuclease HI
MKLNEQSSGVPHNMILSIYCDGYYKATCGGIATWSWVALDKDRNKVESQSGLAGCGEGLSHFVAGYTALINSLRWIRDNEPNTRLDVFSDLELVVHQILGLMECRAENLRPLHKEATTLLASTKANLCWIQGALNKWAKTLSRAQYQEELAKWQAVNNSHGNSAGKLSAP